MILVMQEGRHTYIVSFVKYISSRSDEIPRAKNPTEEFPAGHKSDINNNDFIGGETSGISMGTDGVQVCCETRKGG
jgi:hypothetical protein